MKKIILILIIISPFLLHSQNKKIKIPTYTNVYKTDSGYYSNAIVVDGDTFPHIKIYKIVIFPKRKFKTRRQLRRYNRLVFNLKRVYPYAILIGQYYRDIEQDLQHIPTETQRRKYIKTKEKQLRKQYEDALVNLTISQGRLLIKLVDRETSHTTYEVIQDLKGNMSAYFWQSVARLFGSNLKVEYKPNEEDKMIEEIIAKIENGQI